MLTPASPVLPADAHLPWHGLALLTGVVILAHVALLALAPGAPGPRPSPLANKFITRTIVIAPPQAEPAPPASPPSAPTPTIAAKPAPPKPVRSQRAVRPRPPVPAPTATPPPTPPTHETPGPDLTAERAADPSSEAAPAAEPMAAAPAADSGSAASTGDSDTATASSGAGGQTEGPVPLRIPGSVRLSFAVTGQQGTSPMEGVFGDLVWLQDGRQYDARLSLTFLFRTIRRQTSVGVIGATGLEPTRFSDARKSELASHFVRDEGKIVFSNNAPSVPLLAGAQDRLSIVMQLGALLAGDPQRYPQGAVIAVQMVGPRDADIWSFNVEGEESISLPAGDFAVRKLTRTPRKPFDDKLELWIAPEIGYLPVRIKQTQSNGDFADLQMRELVPLRP